MHILLIEDNPGDIRLLQEYLKEDNTCRFHITQTDRLSIGLERLAAARFDAVLLDLSLPDSQGIDTLLRLHRAAKGVPIVVLTGTEDDVLGVQLIQAGAQDYLVKGQVTGHLLMRSLRYAAERKRAEEAQGRLAAMIEASNDAIMSLTEGRISAWNLSAEKLFGYSSEEILGKSVNILVPSHLCGEVERNIEKLIRGEPVQGYETERVRKDGSIVPISITWSSLKDAQGRMICPFATIRDITARKQGEEALQRALGELRALTRKMEVVREDERTRIARELHDELGMRMTCLKMDLTRLQIIMNSAPPSVVEEKFQSMIEVVDTTIVAVQSLVSELRPGVLDDLGLVAAVEWQCQDLERRSGIRCLVVSEDGDIPLGSTKATAAFRICQEALINVVRHAGAKEIRVRLETFEGVLQLEIHDDGQGILPKTITEATSLGLLGMRERAEAVGGTFRIVGLPGQGTTVTVRVPCG